MATDNNSRNQELLRQQAALAHFGQRALTSDDLDQILTEACRRISEALGTDLAKVMELQDDGETLLVRAGIGWKPGVVGVARTSASDNTSEGHALKTGGPMISPDIEQERRFIYPAFLVDNGVKAVANVPIIGCKGERPYGVLQVDSREPRQFTDSDTTFLTTYANLLAAAVTRLRVTRNLQEGERRLRRSEERLRRVTEIETVGVLFFDAAGRITDANAAFLRMSGLSREDIAAGRVHWEELTSPEWMPATLRALEEMKATGHGKPFEKQYVRKDGSRWWGLFAGRMLDDGGAVEFVLDVTDRKAADQALRASEARLRALVEGIPQLVFRSRSSGARIWGSSQWVNYTGLGEAQSLGLGWLDAVHPEDRPATLDAWQDAEAIGRVSIEHRTRRASDGAWRWFQTRAMPVRNEAGHIIEWFGTSTDIDDQVRARDVLARNRDELEVLVAERTEAL
ncbi:MAG TPA: PAS domain S-box protein, partial [Acetobacteraceae bacterium]|nr:PAS domain S-box protein [Acetobacteraceae bacterium]